MSLVGPMISRVTSSPSKKHRRKRNDLTAMGIGPSLFRRAFEGWLLLVVLCLVPVSGSASPQVEALLQQAESVRSADPRRFERLLLQLNAQRHEAATDQREQLDYLNAYSHAYNGRYEVAIRDARTLLESTSDEEIKFRAGSLIVNCYALLRQFAEGLRQLEQTLALLDKVTSPELRQNGLGVAAFIHNQIGQYKFGLHYADRILADSPPPRTKCLAAQSRLESLQHLNTLPPDDVSLTQVIGQCIEQGETAAANFVRNTLARKWASQGHRD